MNFSQNNNTLLIFLLGYIYCNNYIKNTTNFLLTKTNISWKIQLNQMLLTMAYT